MPVHKYNLYIVQTHNHNAILTIEQAIRFLLFLCLRCFVQVYSSRNVIFRFSVTSRVERWLKWFHNRATCLQIIRKTIGPTFSPQILRNSTCPFNLRQNARTFTKDNLLVFFFSIPIL